MSPQVRSLGRRGFTLVEVLVGIAVGSVVLLAGFAALATVQDRSEHALGATVDALDGATLRGTLVEWLSAAYPQNAQLQLRFDGLDATESALPWDELTFPTRARTILRSPTVVVRLYIDENDTTPQRGLVAELRTSLTLDPKVMELNPKVTGLLIRYLPAAAAADGTVEWAESWTGQNGLPRAIEITLLDSPLAPLPPLLKLPIRVPLATIT